MSKPTMGRGLGALMTERKPPGETENQDGKPQIAAGVRTLMQGAGPAAAPEVIPASSSKITRTPMPKSSSPTISNPKGPAIPRWYFLAADGVLIGLALLIEFKSPKPMPTSRMIMAIIVTVLAAGCGLCALLAGPEKD